MSSSGLHCRPQTFNLTLQSSISSLRGSLSARALSSALISHQSNKGRGLQRVNISIMCLIIFIVPVSKFFQFLYFSVCVPTPRNSNAQCTKRHPRILAACGKGSSLLLRTLYILTLILNNAQCARSPIVLYYSSVTSTLVAALEIWPPSKCRAKLDHEIKCRRSEISRKYGISMNREKYYL